MRSLYLFSGIVPGALMLFVGVLVGCQTTSKDGLSPLIERDLQVLSAQAMPAEPASDRPQEDVEASLHAIAQLKAYLQQDRAHRGPIDQQLFADVALTKDDASEAQRLLWADHAEHLRAERGDEMQARELKVGEHVMPFYYSVSGKAPESGRSLYISMHGGGQGPERLNTQQWENQKRLYNIKEGVYVAPRAPTDTWNMWHQGHIDVLFDRLIENMIVLGGVDPNRVYLMGYSAGGDGVYQLAPRMADRFAAAAMMAGHPNEAKPLGLRNLPFTIHMGENDNAFKRNEVAKQWGEKLDALHKQDPGGYVHLTKLHEGKGHWMDRQDAAALPWMAKHTRDPLPDRVVWYQDDVTHSRFYWLAVPDEQQQKGTLVRAQRSGQVFEIDTQGVRELTIRLSDGMVDLDRPIKVVSGGKTLFDGRAKRTIAVLAKTLAERGDPEMLFSSEVTVTLPKS